ncbi:MFS transporter [Streptomyces sp. NPDC091371]|uniref:MFS transporter n=1 Tax=Streptomyces sp. NPDC091371 TaxID=3155303 RepID=UPI00341AA55F
MRWRGAWASPRSSCTPWCSSTPWRCPRSRRSGRCSPAGSVSCAHSASGTTLIANVYGERERGRALALYAGLAQVFFVVGPVAGAVLIEYLGWFSVFLVNVPVGALALWAIAESHVRDEAPGGALTAGQPCAVVLSLGAFVLGLYTCGVWGVTDARTLTTLVGGALALAVTVRFVLRSPRSPRPLVDLRLLRIRR